MLSVFEPGCFKRAPLVSQFGVDPCAGTAEIGLRHWHAPCTGIVAGGFQGPAGKPKPSKRSYSAWVALRFLTSLPDFKRDLTRSGPSAGGMPGPFQIGSALRRRGAPDCSKWRGEPLVPRRVRIAPKISGNAAEDR